MLSSFLFSRIKGNSCLRCSKSSALRKLSIILCQNLLLTIKVLLLILKFLLTLLQDSIIIVLLFNLFLGRRGWIILKIWINFCPRKPSLSCHHSATWHCKTVCLINEICNSLCFVHLRLFLKLCRFDIFDSVWVEEEGPLVAGERVDQVDQVAVLGHLPVLLLRLLVVVQSYIVKVFFK